MLNTRDLAVVFSMSVVYITHGLQSDVFTYAWTCFKWFR